MGWIRDEFRMDMGSIWEEHGMDWGWDMDMGWDWDGNGLG